MTRLSLMITLALGVVLASGCAAKQTLTTDSTSAAQRGATVAGAEDVPQASLALQRSKEGLERAELLYADGKKDEAASQLERAEADAELAIVIAQAANQKTEANAAMERVRQVQSDN